MDFLHRQRDQRRDQGKANCEPTKEQPEMVDAKLAPALITMDHIVMSGVGSHVSMVACFIWSPLMGEECMRC